MGGRVAAPVVEPVEYYEYLPDPVPSFTYAYYPTEVPIRRRPRRRRRRPFCCSYAPYGFMPYGYYPYRPMWGRGRYY
jgi:hypothetical protein